MRPRPGGGPTCSIPSCLPLPSWACRPDECNPLSASGHPLPSSSIVGLGSPLPEACWHPLFPISFSLKLWPFIDFFSTLSLTAHLDPRGACRTSPAWPGGGGWVSEARSTGLSLYGRRPWDQRGQGLAPDHTTGQGEFRIQRLLTASLLCSILPVSPCVGRNRFTS